MIAEPVVPEKSEMDHIHICLMCKTLRDCTVMICRAIYERTCFGCKMRGGDEG